MRYFISRFDCDDTFVAFAIFCALTTIAADPFANLLDQAHAKAARNRANRLSEVYFPDPGTNWSGIPRVNTISSPWPTRITQVRGVREGDCPCEDVSRCRAGRVRCRLLTVLDLRTLSESSLLHSSL